MDRGASLKKMLFSLFLILLSFACMAEEKSVLLKTADDATNIGQLVVEITYGKEVADRERPFTARLSGDTWIVLGTLKTVKGGVAEVHLNRFNGAVLDVTHGK